jgi:hypothetical protein
MRWAAVALAALILGAVLYAYVTRPASGPGPAPEPGPIVDQECEGPGDPCQRGYECIQRCGPPVAREDDPPPGWYCAPIGKPQVCPICLAEGTMIDAPEGPVNVKDVGKGTIVWTIDASGARVAAPVLEVSRMAAPPSHRVVRLVMADGRETRISPEHPTIDGRHVGDLRAGDVYEGVTVRSAALESYGADATYDLLPEGIGVYWADGILMGSTLAR